MFIASNNINNNAVGESHIIKAMMNSSCYPHQTDKIELIETHISYVFLTGSFVYKIKKSIKFDFVDYSSLASRKYYCEEELRINQRYAPHYYLDIVAITKNDHGVIEIAGEGEIIEYAVKMKQFPQDSVLSETFSCYASQIDLFDQLGQVVANFHHSQLKTAQNDSEYGSSLIVWQAMEDNFNTIASLDIDAPIKDIKTWSEQQINTLTGMFEQRKREGFIRECHGDLHLGNIAVIDGKPVLFDGIEFNSQLRYIDTISEIAFIIADLEYRFAYEAATIFLNSYLDITGDYFGLSLLNFYKVYRSMVRAKIALIRCQQEQGPHYKREYQRYCQLAKSYITQQPNELFITHGISGSGKTTLAKKAAKRYCAVHIRSDVIRKKLFGLNVMDKSHSSLNENIYSASATEQTYDHLARISDVLLQAGFNVIVDASFLQQDARSQFYSLAKEHGVDFSILDCPVSKELAIQRINARVDDPSEATSEIVEYQIEHQDLLTRAEEPYRTLV